MAKEIFIQALRFDLSTHILLSGVLHYLKNSGGLTPAEGGGYVGTLKDAQEAPTLIPAAVCEAFCVELYLKCILCADGQEYPKNAAGHNLLSLFKAMSDDWKARLVHHFQIEVNGPEKELLKNLRGDEDLPYYLEQASSGFQKWRYAFEGKLSGQNLMPVRKAIYTTIVERIPEWAAVRDDLTSIKKESRGP